MRSAGSLGGGSVVRVPRALWTAPTAFVVTFLLFLGMRALIDGVRGEDEERSNAQLIDFVRLSTDSVVQERVREMPKRKPPPEQPPPPQVSTIDTGHASAIDVPKHAFSASALGTATFKPRGNIGPRSPPSDAEATPVVRVAPVYPPREAEQGITGFVTVRFRVGSAGQVVNPEVIAADPPGRFERAALKAVRKWKYKPKVVDGRPVEYPVTPVKLVFEL